MVFDGPAGEFVLVVVQLWEADRSPEEFYDKLMLALEAWLDRPFWMDLTMEIITAISGIGGTMIGTIDSIVQIFVSLKEALRDLFANADDLSSAIARFKPGETADVEIRREGKSQTLKVKLQERPLGDPAGG